MEEESDAAQCLQVLPLDLATLFLVIDMGQIC